MYYILFKDAMIGKNSIRITRLEFTRYKPTKKPLLRGFLQASTLLGK